MSEMLTTTELAQRYPVADANCEKAWFRILDRWRTSGRLQEGTHWRIRRKAGSRPVREYAETQVLRLVWKSDNLFAVSVRLECGEAVKAVLNEARDKRETVGV